MSARTILAEAIECGISISLNGGKLALEADVKPPDELIARLKEHKAEIVAILRKEATDPVSPPLNAGNPPPLSAAGDALTPAAKEMERETYLRLPEQASARGGPPFPSSVPPLLEQGDYCAGRGMDYLAAFWKELTPAEKQCIGKSTLAAWNSIAREGAAGSGRGQSALR